MRRRGKRRTPFAPRTPPFLGGKILRLDRDGAVPADNPIPGSPVYSMGHRNPQGLAWHPISGALYASEHGLRRRDEINRIRPGRNHGWGAYECGERRGHPLGPEPVVLPAVCTRYWTMAPSGMQFVADPASPWHGDLFVASLRGKHLRRFRFGGETVGQGEIFFVSDRAEGDTLALDRRIRDVEYRDGALYVLGDGYGLVRISPAAAEGALGSRPSRLPRVLPGR
ncbi:MAG: PQQ-dependent sugar dehydrogenase [Proteobacteria bacterium]|nr:PQQ-dependent sugar dehydrogenase [Pseudomonadota bacterium]